MDFTRAWQTIVDMVNGIIAGLPNFLLALILFGIFYTYCKKTTYFTTFNLQKKNCRLVLLLNINKISC